MDRTARRSNASSRDRIAVGTIPKAESGKAIESERRTGVNSGEANSEDAIGATTIVTAAIINPQHSDSQKAVFRCSASISSR